MKKFLVVIFLLLGLSSFGVKPTQAEAPIQPKVLEYIEIKTVRVTKVTKHKEVVYATSTLVLMEKLRTYADTFGQDIDLMNKVVTCESGWNTKAIGDSGKAYGLAQFHLPTFLGFEKEYGKDLDYKNPDHQLELMAWAFANGKKSHWSCWYLVRGLPVPGLR